MPEITAWLVDLASSPWLLPALFLLVVGDAFLVVLPSETAVVALAALAAASGEPNLLLVPVAASGAVVGDLLCFLIGRGVGVDRWAWQRRGRVAAAIGRPDLHRPLHSVCPDRGQSLSGCGWPAPSALPSALGHGRHGVGAP